MYMSTNGEDSGDTWSITYEALKRQRSWSKNGTADKWILL